ncbi:MAG TPA: LamG domain-containing protein, partial [bacterium]|nr:LamG domain-containing protein [bacterium]
HPGTYDYFGDVGTAFTAGTWYHRKNSAIGGIPRTGESSVTSEYNRWHTGTKYAKVLFINNYSASTTQVTYIKNLVFYPITDGKCEGDTRTYHCVVPTTGFSPDFETATDWNSVPYYTQTWTWDSGTGTYQWLPADDPITDYNLTADSSSCRYKCSGTYHSNGSSCVSNSKTWTCPAKPANSDWNMYGASGTIGQYWNGSAYVPSDDTTTEYNIIPSTDECRYVCSTGYRYDPFSKTCYAVVCGDGDIEKMKDELSSTSVNPATGLLDPGYYMGVVLGNASMGSNEIILTPAAGSQYGRYSYQYEDSGTKYYNFGTRFIVSFDFYSGGGTNPGGDAVYFYAYNTDYPTTEHSATGGYIFAYDEYEDRIHVSWNGVEIATAAQVGLDNARWNRGVIFVEEQSDGKTKIKMFVNKALKIDVTDVARSKTGTLFGFGARTGGAYNQHKIKNIIMSAEVCDAGSAMNNSTSYNGCSSDCMSFGPGCGNASVESPDEPCDTGLAAVDPSNYSSSATCDSDCTWNKYCGDGIFQRANCSGYSYDSCEPAAGAAEECDPGKNYNNDEGTKALCNNKNSQSRGSYYTPATRPSCNASCGIVNYTIGTNCTYCGDGVENSTSELGTGCDYSKSYTAKALCAKAKSLPESTFYDGSVASCNSSCSVVSSQCYYCGDGLMTANTDLVMYLKMDENSGYYAYDSSENDYSGYVTTGYNWTTGNTNNGYAMNFTGSSNMTVSSAVNLGTARSIEFWINTSQSVSADPPAPVLHKGVHAGVLNYAVWLEPAKNGIANPHLSFVFYNNSTSGCGVHNTTKINDGLWHHVASTYDGSYMRVYVDGALQNSEACSLTPSSSTESLRIGWNNIAGYPLFVGRLDELKLYNRTLTAAEIIASMKEKCDLGANNGVYGSGCSSDCQIGGPRCGDGTVQSSNGETCDDWKNGNNATAGTPGTTATDGCYDNCTKWNPKGTHESASTTLIKGWGCDEDSPGTNIGIHAYFLNKNGTQIYIKTLTTGDSRTDVQSAGHCTAKSTHGWSFNPQADSALWTQLYTDRMNRPFTVTPYGINVPSIPPGVNPSYGPITFGGFCGDGSIQSEFGEVCDSSNLAGKTCATYGYASGTLSCNSTCTGWVTTNCYTCGNNVKEAPETCDGTDLGG